MKIENITRELRNAGTCRLKYPLPVDRDEKKRYIREIGLALLKNRKIPYDAVPEVEGTIIDWVYMQRVHVRDFWVKGIMFKGPTGTGKTFAMKILLNLLKVDRQCFLFNGEKQNLELKMINATRLVEVYLNNPEDTLVKYTKEPVLCIDDLGSEPVATSYGNRVNIVERIIYKREENGKLTFATTNLEKFSDVYDERIVSRMNSLFNVVVLNGKDRRKGL